MYTEEDYKKALQSGNVTGYDTQSVRTWQQSQGRPLNNGLKMPGESEYSYQERMKGFK